MDREQAVNIRKYSGQLHKMLADLGPELNRPMVDFCFTTAIEHGGLTERDFVRPAESSYNPRPARVAYILIRDCGITDSETLAAGLLAAVCEATLLPTENHPGVRRLAQQARLAPADLTALAGATAAKQIAVAVRLDRARHFHLSNPSRNELADFLRETEQYIPLAEEVAPRVGMLLGTWFRRFSAKI